MSDAPSMTVGRLNELILFFGEHEKAALRAEKRGSMTSALFDLPRRSVLGWRVKYEHEARFLREVTAVLTPEEIGRRMKVPGSRPYYLQLFLLMQDMLGARQQRMLELGLQEGDAFPEERLDDLFFVVDTWERISRVYRNDGRLLPDEAGRTQEILPEDTLDEIRGMLHPLRDGELASLRRLAGTLDLFCFAAHGEQRDGIFGHGPYAGANGCVLFCKEFNDLRNDFLPWARTQTRNVCSNIVFAYECRDVETRFDMFGGVVTEPLEFAERIERVAVLTQEGGTLRRLSPAEWGPAQEACAEATNEIYFTVVDWPERYRVEYGALLFANHMKPFLDLAGIDGDERLAAAAAATAAHYVDQLIAGPDVPATMVHWGTTDGPLFWPVVAVGAPSSGGLDR
jgi:hypothetical protein